VNLIRLGDTTDHGGEVITASGTMRYGRGIRSIRTSNPI
jgi:uncharacterized Zn-binding protein involved in type VI secretion